MAHEKVKKVVQEKPYGMVSQFESPKEVYHAAEKLRDEGFKKFEVYKRPRESL